MSKEFIDGTNIVATDIEITAAAFGAEPDPADVGRVNRASGRREGGNLA